MIFIKDLLRISLRQVFRQKKRSIGIVLAIALGTAGLIAIVTVGDEVKKNLNRDLDLLGGATLLNLGFHEEKDPYSRRKYFLDKTIMELRRLPGVSVVSKATEDIYWGNLPFKGKNIPTPVQGVDEWYWAASSLSAVKGTLLGPSDVKERALVCVIGEVLAQSLYGDEDPLGEFLRIQKDLYRIIGVVGGLQIGDRKKYAFIPVTTMVDRCGERYLADRLYLRCKTWDDVRPVVSAIPGIVEANQDPKFLYIEASWKQLDRFVAIVWWVELFLYLSIASTLVIGGFGIWNGMMTSVTARTREIGLKKAMGASPVDIMGQFLCESLWLSLCAGLLGVALGYGLVEGVCFYLGSSPNQEIFITYSCMSVTFSAVLGIIAGFYPALKAASMDAVSAIRYE